ncbi:MAG: hypothetical protein H0T72_00515, partial [Chloroflexia bacterium]|nr:hypothetical protein [Chloroflexia bacterium]
MPDSKRQCSRCQFFQNAQLSGNGWCTHPKRQVASDLKILVREKELACRNSWGDDLWIDASATAAAPIITPAPRQGLTYTNRRVDDEVTSVVDTASKHAPASPVRGVGTESDDIVTFTSVRSQDAGANPDRSRPYDLNAPANADQADRARYMARGNKDAIQKARERHTQRRKPVRQMIEPDPSPEPGSDRILEAQDRDRYNRQDFPYNRQDLPNDHAPRDDYENTPPVPREEVEASGQALSPAVGSDVRFDSVPQLKPEVDLSLLRGFLNRGHARGPRRDATDDHGRPASAFDMVLKQAREVRAAGDLELRNRQHPPGGHYAPVSAPLQEPSVSDTSEPNASARVVWDVDGERLTIAFDRARVAIERPVASEPRAAATIDLHDRQVDTTFALLEPARPAVAIDDEDAPADDPSEATYHEFDDDPAFAGETYRADDDDDVWEDAPGAPRHAESHESPHASWWRSLNFGRKRRYGSQPVQQPWREDFDDELAAEGEYATGYDDFDDTPGYDITPENPVDPEAAFATSEESWLQDEWAFPEPQPLEWHETRARLLHAQAEPIVQSPDSTERSSAQPAFTMPGENPCAEGEPFFAVASARPASPFFAIDEPAGMDAFRAALFDDRRQPGSPANDPDDMPMVNAHVAEPGVREIHEYASSMATDQDLARPIHEDRSVA